jgi:hypothetical protein
MGGSEMELLCLKCGFFLTTHEHEGRKLIFPCPNCMDRANTEGSYDQLRSILGALEIAMSYGGSDGSHHKSWVIDQMVRELTGDGYDRFIQDAKKGEDGPDTYAWDVGIAP